MHFHWRVNECIDELQLYGLGSQAGKVREVGAGAKNDFCEFRSHYRGRTHVKTALFQLS